MRGQTTSRREFLKAAAATAVAPMALASGADSRAGVIPVSGERIPAIGLGSWITFDVTDPAAIRNCQSVISAFFELGGTLIDSSPMYGRSPDVIGASLTQLKRLERVFSASKVWTMGADNGRQQIEMSRARWGVAHFDLVQVHNMMDWRAHLPTLQSMQRQEQLRYIGITTSHGRRHDAIATALRQERIDTVQLTYNIAERSAEDTLLPLAQDRGVAVIVNRPFATGALFRRVAGVSLPGWAREIECQDWAAVFLKFIISHPAVTVAIPATSQVAHLRQNMRALNGPLPDAALRRRMASDFDRVAR